ncbi:A-kinase anchor protein 1, mitochondrial [Triplophysa rosa]|uniref:A-kinase anchor protein 1 n=1 Tax=Triplophysa rosa TaxID=992332 RepID=A0A9W7WCB0_TRIRA|nr:A-kinase anchor protein 1, mitochondrial [Triplophysa rosa]XP_057177323.1 A-kinase anchor protein 1, mitochondrial [Triplophysa rosa]KAI7793669.1 putative A-kinase anchor protein 1 [Triplophysa rosa]
MQLPYRPLVSVSVVTLLGWCWYSFRRRRTAHLLTEEDVCFLDEKSLESSSPAGSESNLQMDHSFSGSDISNSTDASKVLKTNNPGIPTAPGLTKGVRPDPEGEVSIRSRNEKTIISTEDLPHCGEACEDDSGLESDPVSLSASCLSISTGQQSGPVSSDSHESSNLSDLSPDQEDTEKINSSLVQQVIAGEKCELDCALRPQEDPVQRQNFNEDSSDDSSKTPLQTIGSFRERSLGSSVGNDSGCGSCLSEDAVRADRLTSELSEEGQGFLITPGGAENKMIPSVCEVVERVDEACRELVVENFNCVSAEASVNSSGSAPSPDTPIILWDVEVPANLVGQLIGKQGKFVNFLKQRSGAKIYISTLPFTQDFQICHIQGSQRQVDNALALIQKKFKDLDLSHCIPMPCLPVTSWLLLPQDVFVEVIVSRVEAGYHLFVHQYNHPLYRALPTLMEHMHFCYSQPGCPGLPKPVEVGVVCAAPVTGSGWQRAQVIQYDEESDTAHIRNVDNGGYDAVNSSTLRQIRSDFVTLPFQSAEVLLDNIAPLPGEVEFSLEAKTALEEITVNTALILKVTGSQDGLPLVHMWKQMVDEVVLVNKLLADRGVCTWLDAQ